ncbi:unnamed protein product, partial [Meganyctiphanes norvegica]
MTANPVNYQTVQTNAPLFAVADATHYELPLRMRICNSIQHRKSERRKSDPNQLSYDVHFFKWDPSGQVRRMLQFLLLLFRLPAGLSSLHPPEKHLMTGRKPHQSFQGKNHRDLFSPIRASKRLTDAMKAKASKSADTFLFDRFECEKRLYESQQLLGLSLALVGRGLMGVSSAFHKVTHARRELFRKFVRLDVAPYLYSFPPSASQLFGGKSLQAQSQTGSRSENSAKGRGRSRSRKGKDSGLTYSPRIFTKVASFINDSVISSFLKRDTCRRYADCYLLAMTFTYLIRAKIPRISYDRKNFFAALYLAHDMEEDEEELKYELFPWLLGATWRKTYPTLLQARDDIFWAIDCRAVVSKKCCDQEKVKASRIGFRQQGQHNGSSHNYFHEKLRRRPRGPEKSPLRCWMCLEKECEDSDTSYLLYVSNEETDDSIAADGTFSGLSRKDCEFDKYQCELCTVQMVKLANAMCVRELPDRQKRKLLNIQPLKRLRNSWLCLNFTCNWSIC